MKDDEEWITTKELLKLIPYSRQHIQRLEDAGRFPKRIRVGNGPRSRIAWIASEVRAWRQQRVNQRAAQ